MGSNVLVSDKGFAGVVICGSEGEIWQSGESIFVSAFCKVGTVVRFCLDRGLAGWEWAAGLPSTVGGAIVGNAGARDGCVGDFLTKCTVLLDNGEIKEYNNRECKFAYRSSRFKTSAHTVHCGTRETLLSAEFLLTKKSKASILQKMRDHTQARWETQPKGKTMGCVFKNGCEVSQEGKSVVLSTGRLIDQCGLKGLRVGSAVVSDKHANFVINHGTNAKDIYDLIAIIKNKVHQSTGIQLQEEIVYIGDFGD